jgi:hypothetical protein
MESLIRTLADSDTLDRVNSRLSKGSAELAVKAVRRKLESQGYEVIIKHGTETVFKQASQRASGQAIGILIAKNAGKSIALFSVLYAAGSAYADTGSKTDAAIAGAREMVSADLVEGAVQFTVVVGEEVVFDGSVQASQLKHAQSLANLIGDESTKKCFLDSVADFQERASKRKAYEGESLWESLRKMWNSPPLDGKSHTRSSGSSGR